MDLPPIPWGCRVSDDELIERIQLALNSIHVTTGRDPLVEARAALAVVREAEVARDMELREVLSWYVGMDMREFPEASYERVRALAEGFLLRTTPEEVKGD
jgi:hypothetical protein